MFAVPGWSVSADSLQAEASGPAGANSKKRKRAAAQSVTASNVADLYESVVEGKKANEAPKQDQAKAAKRHKTASDASGKSGEHGDGARKATKDKDKKDKKEKRGAKKEEQKQPPQDAGAGSGSRDKAGSGSGDKAGSGSGDKAGSAAPPPGAQAVAAPLPQPPKPAKLTPLQASMREKLVSARFRHLNETLYTRPSAEAFRLFDESPDMFDEYHEGFRRQIKAWPENPVDSFLADIRARAAVRPRPPPAKGRPPPPTRLPLPRTAGTCTVADLGCGGARLAESLRADGPRLRLDVRSFDLQSPSPLVTRADMADLPLADGSVNVAIFCLALMGTNWLDFVDEAYRILHWKGELWVAEIKSRFGPVRGTRSAGPVDHSVGNRRRPAAGKKGKGARADDDDDDDDDDAAADAAEDLAVEVDGADDRRRETDVSAFVEALRKRGFVLQGERAKAVDLSNRMFAKMHFIKGASPTRGKGAKPPQGASRGKKAFAPKRDDGDGNEADDVNEAAILKPCVYKIR